jgi:FeS assembly SUF system regulator
MLRISKLTDYATIIVSFMARASEGVASAASIARGTHLALPTVSKILKKLSQAGLINSFRGTGGGYRLAYTSEKISIAQILVAMEGPVAMTECCATMSACALDPLCAVKDNWKAINHYILTALGSLTLQDMLQPLTAQSLMLKGIPVTVKGF